MVSPLQDKAVQDFSKAMEDVVLSLPENDKFKKAKQDLLDGLWDDILYGVVDRMPEAIEGFVKDMASRAVTEMLEGREDQVKRYLRLDGYTGRDHDHDVIHGTIFETGAIQLRKKIAQAHADLIQNERIADLESQLSALEERVRERDVEIERLRELRSNYGMG